jgi:hypothetical protein
MAICGGAAGLANSSRRKAEATAGEGCIFGIARTCGNLTQSLRREIFVEGKK